METLYFSLNGELYASAPGLSLVEVMEAHGITDSDNFTLLTEEEYSIASAAAFPHHAWKEKKIRQIDNDTQNAIVQGFTYKINGAALFFSYDGNDQQNFADAANKVMMSIMGLRQAPASISWKARPIGGSGEKTADSMQLSLSHEEFLSLYLDGALAHKERCLEEGMQRKNDIQMAES